MSTKEDRLAQVVYVGRSRGCRTWMRPMIAAALGVAASKVTFRETDDADADSEIRRLTLNRWNADGTAYSVAVTWSEMRDVLEAGMP